MKFNDAMAIVRDLAYENILELGDAQDNCVEEIRSEQIEAVGKMDEFLDLLRGHHL
jgi:hypothetical protein